MAQGFRQAMRLMRSRDPQRQEDGFHQLLPHAADHVDELIAQLEQEQDDHGLRCWLLELFGAARSPAALPLLRTQLDSDDEALRSWAAAGLAELNTPGHGPCSGAPVPTARSANRDHDLRPEP